MWNEIPPHYQNGLVRKYIVNLTETDTETVFQETSLTESIVLYSLHPFYTYIVSIAAYTIEKGPFSSPVIFTMDEDGKHLNCSLHSLSHGTFWSVPSSSPTNLSSLVINPREVMLRWSPPPLAGQNGVITSYTVIVMNMQTGTEQAYVCEVTSLSLSSLSPYTTYESEVAANTTIGMGPFTTSIVFLTPEDG